MHRTLIALLLATGAAHAQPANLPGKHEADLRLRKCAYIWVRLEPCHFSRDISDFFVQEHARAGIPGEWLVSLVYAHSGSGLDPGMTYSAGGMTARGLMDATELQYPRGQCLRRFGTTDLHDPWVSIATHVYQAAGIHASSGREGMALLRAVFLPQAPDGQRAWQEQTGRWEPRDARFRRIVAAGYASGAIWSMEDNDLRRMVVGK